MRKALAIAVICTLLMLICPILSVNPKKTDELPPSKTESTTPESTDLSVNKTSIKVLNTATGNVTEMSKEDYLVCVLAAEMPALYSEEALKAQAVAANTFLMYKSSQNSEKDYDITDSTATDQGFYPKEQFASKWGDKAGEYEQKLRNCVKATENEAIYYKGKPINAVYHAISGGKTESAENVWGKKVAYLVSVSSESDKLSEKYITTAVFTYDELKERLKEKVSLNDSPYNCFSDIKRTKAGTVKSITAEKTELTGGELREILGLRSANFEISFADSCFTFTVYGYGHGVGMSQNGANDMAKQGFSYKEILKHYYPLTTVK